MTTYYGPRTCVQTPDGKTSEVKNLGWLIRHSASVETLTLAPRDDGARCGCILHADLCDGSKYRTAFNSAEICRQWVKRRCLKQAKLIDNVPA